MYHIDTIGLFQIEPAQAEMDRTGIGILRLSGEPFVILRTLEQVFMLVWPGAGGGIGIGIIVVGHVRSLPCRHDRPYRPDAPTPWYKRTSGGMAP